LIKFKLYYNQQYLKNDKLQMVLFSTFRKFCCLFIRGYYF